MRLLVDTPRGAVRAIAVVLHGGRETSVAAVRSTQLAVLRMRPFVRSLRRSGQADGLAVAQVRYGVRGWNGAQRSPVADVEQALDELAARFPGVPIALVGHSMGGRAAIYAAGHDGVRAVIGVAPWIEQRDPVRTLAGRRVLIAHGDRDRMTNPRASAAYARAAEPYAESVTFVSIAGERHAMLRRARLWHELSTGFVLGVLFDRRPEAGATDDASRVLSGALAGQPALVV
ncbi:MAG TPA: alpha/beta fold hydrolase [Jatrophihabitantaceae bacterium]|nr:alpha/beta fold hydrolase [Jatrophihabitantaceae bacterium]